MKALHTPLIANRATRQLSALGYKQLNRIIAKAAEVKGLHRYAAEFTPVKNHVITLVHSLIFEHNISKEQLSAFQKGIKVINNQLQLPSMATQRV